MVNLLKPQLELRNGYKDKKRLVKIHDLPCSLCFYLKKEQRSPTEAHHKHGEGLGLKCSDLLTCSLCMDRHTKGEFAFHKIGRVAWEDKFGIDQDFLIEVTNKMLEYED